ncbi:MAG: hypothetical protein LBV17_01260 [Treponema sp.]|jgi:hypothetical protein|nr:hypothetical protein [Treponema sp.]
MNNEQVIKKVASCLFENAEKLKHGTVSVTLTVHEGRVVTVCHELKETIRKREEVKE